MESKDYQEALHLQNLKVKSIENSTRNDKKTRTLEEGLNPLKSHVTCLKFGVVESKVALLFCDALEDSDGNKENWLTVDEVQEQQRMNKSKKESENGKKQIRDVEEDLKKLAEAIQASNESIQKKKLLVENKLSIIKEKEAKVKKLQERQQKLEEKKTLCFDGFGKDVSKESLQEKWRQTHGAMKQCRAAIESLKEHNLLLESEQKSLQKVSQGLEEKLSLLKSKEKKLFEQNEEQKGLRSLTDLVASISGLRIRNITKNSFTIEIHDIYDQELPADYDTATEGSTLLLTLQFAEVDGQVIVEDVKTNSHTFFIKDIIEQVKSSSRLKVFIFEVQKRFHNQAKLLKEMKTLQERFAIDWNDERQSVRVMLGKAGQIVGTLKIHDGYPMAGYVSVEEIHGADRNVLFQDTLVTNGLKSLTSWIEYLHAKYGSL